MDQSYTNGDDSPMFNRYQYGSSAPLNTGGDHLNPPSPLYVQAPPPAFKTDHPDPFSDQHQVKYGDSNGFEAKINESQRFAGNPAANISAWNSDIYNCCDDGFTCCLTTCCPCITFGQIAQSVDEDQSLCLVNGLVYTVGCLLMMPCCCSWVYRKKLREKYNLPEEPYTDFWTHCCLEPCALCQEYRELKYRGVDPTKVVPLQMVAPTTMVMM